MGLVSTWLNGIGLSHAVPSFQAAGIVTPSALAKLELVHYEALGVKEPNDRKKLFYLVQRIKMAVDEDDDDDSIIEQVDRLEDTHPVRNRSNKSSPASVERYDYQENAQSPQRSQNDSGSNLLDEDDSTELDSHQYDAEADRRKSSRRISGSSRRKKESTPNDSGLSAASSRSTRSSKRQDSSKENKRALERKSLSSLSLRSEAEKKVSKLKKLVNSKPRTYHTSIKNGAVEDKTNGDNEFDEDAVTSSRSSLKESRAKKAVNGSSRRSLVRTGSGKVSSDRSSDRRLSEQLSKSKIFADHDSVEISFDDINDVDNSGLDIAKSESFSSTNKNKRQSLPAAGRAVSSNGEKVRRSSISSASSVDTMSESENGSDFGASQTSVFFKKLEKKREPKSRNGRKTEVKSQSNKGRYESKLQNPVISGRAGSKGLSTIPSEEAAIMSPLVKITSSQLEESALARHVTRDKKNRLRASTGSQSLLMSKSFDSAGISGSDSDSRPSSRRSIQPPRASGRRDQASVQSSISSVASSRSGVSSLTKEKMDRSKSPQYVRPSPKSGIAQPTARRNNREKSRSRSPVHQSPSRDRLIRGNTKSFDDRTDTGASADQIMTNKVFVHGMPDDTSWSAQVSRLREASEVEHSEQLYNEGHVVDEEEMPIRVIVRKRPMSKREASASDSVDVIQPLTYNNYGRVLVYQPKTRVDLTKEIETLPFAFDNVFDEVSSNLDIYDSTVRNLIPGVFDGKWASVFAYGQTGSGKTFTMMGSGLTGKKAGNQRNNDSENFGLYYLAAQDLFKQANQRRNQHISVGASLFEIYGGKLFDLLNNRHPIKCLEDQKGKVCFPGLSEHPVSDADELMTVIEQGASKRSTGTTSANADSSRSHAVLQLSLRKQVGRQSNVEHARLSFIDLAGSERGADTDKACRTTRLEGAEINTSLLALKEVIRALATGGKMAHIPFRGSKLTQVLKQGFVGKNSRTVMVSCVAPNLSNCDHTLNTLRYADRVKERNAETGQLVGAATASSIKTSKSATTPTGNSSRPARSTFSETENMDDEEDDEPNEEMDANNSYSMEELVSEDEDDDSVVLNNILSQTSPQASPTRAGQKVKNQNKTESISSKKQAAQALIETHRTVMTGMLGIVKHEMTLVNTTDADRDKIEDYLVDLETVHDEQLSMLSNLRESLLEYYGSRDSARPRHSDIPHNRSADTSGVLSDGSFEDLRD
eukprot:scaffold52289_cov51-Attheya_sp.AAC.6